MATQNTTPNYELLYHYTSFEAFYNIVNNKKIWATESKYLNDSTEFQYGLKLAKEVFNERDVSPSDAARSFFNVEKRLDTYIFSLSKQGDLLSQWRAYCPDGGVSIGFSRDTLERIASQHRFSLVECIYEEEKQRHGLRDILEARISESDFYAQFPKIIAAFKHPSFSEEGEYRFVSESQTFDQGLYTRAWRATQAMPIQYTEVTLASIDGSEITRLHPELSTEEIRKLGAQSHSSGETFNLEPFRHIIVSPSPHQKLVQTAVEDFIADYTRYGLTGRSMRTRSAVEVSNSKIPYRAK